MNFLLGCVIALSLPPIGFLPGIIIAIPAFLWLLSSRRSQLEYALSGGCLGAGFFASGMYWLVPAFIKLMTSLSWLFPFLIVGVPLLLGSFWAVAAGISYYFRQRPALFALAFSLLLSLAEYGRSNFITEMPWNLVGYGAYRIEPFMQLLGVGGPYALTALLIEVCGLPFVWWYRDTDPWARPVTYAVLIITLVGTLWGLTRLMSPAHYTDDLTFQIFQPGKEIQAEFLVEHMSPTLINLYIFPETTLTMHRDQSTAPYAEIARRMNIPSAIAAIGVRRIIPHKGAAETRNSLVFINQRGEVLDTYDKSRLVPWSEKIPHESLLRSSILKSLLEGTASLKAGEYNHTLTLPGLPPFSPQICYEIAYPGLMPSRDDRPAFILLVSSDEWTEGTAHPFQSLIHARLRAIETGLPVLRSANTGISTIIDGKGRILSLLEMGTRGSITGMLPLPEAETWYSYYGDTPFIILSCLFLISGRIRRFWKG